MRRYILFLIIALSVAFSVVISVDAQGSEADLIIINGKVITVDKGFFH